MAGGDWDVLLVCLPPSRSRGWSDQVLVALCRKGRPNSGFWGLAVRLHPLLAGWCLGPRHPPDQGAGAHGERFDS